MILYRMFGEDDQWDEFILPPSWTALKTLAESWGFDIREVDDNGSEVRCYYPYRGLYLEKLNELPEETFNGES